MLIQTLLNIMEHSSTPQPSTPNRKRDRSFDHTNPQEPKRSRFNDGTTSPVGNSNSLDNEYFQLMMNVNISPFH